MANRGWLSPFWDDERKKVDRTLSGLSGRVESLFEDFTRGFLAENGKVAMRSNVSETDGEICVTVELPGIEQGDVDVMVSGDRITIKGEKKSEKEEKGEEDGRMFHRLERSSGSFQRTLAVPFQVDSDAVRAEFRDGVLTVTISKPAGVVEKAKRIEIKQAT